MHTSELYVNENRIAPTIHAHPKLNNPKYDCLWDWALAAGERALLNDSAVLESARKIQIISCMRHMRYSQLAITLFHSWTREKCIIALIANQNLSKALQESIKIQSPRAAMTIVSTTLHCAPFKLQSTIRLKFAISSCFARLCYFESADKPTWLKFSK